jgi:Flp pilus assembly protein TadD
MELGRLYGSARKYDQALAKLNAGLAVNPKNVVTLMLMGVILQQKGEVAQAQAAYEKILALNPRFAPAANNLAWIHSEHGGEPAKDRALSLAQMAKQVAPDDPFVSSTLGWVLYKRGVYQRALAPLREGGVRLPDNAELQYHLGMAAVRTGDKDVARNVARPDKARKSGVGARAWRAPPPPHQPPASGCNPLQDVRTRLPRTEASRSSADRPQGARSRPRG